MLPIRDHNPSGRMPYVTYALIAINLIIFAAHNVPLGESRALNVFFAQWGMIPAFITDGERLFTLVTSQFLHGGYMHIAGNMLFLWIFGDNMEDEMGHIGFLLFYLTSGVFAALAQWIVEPASVVVTIGASGAIAGIMGGYLLLFPKAKVDILLILIVFFRILPISAWIMLGLWFLLQVGNGVASDPDLGGVAYWAHAGGFVIGLVLTIPIFIKLGGFAFWQKTHGAPPHPEARYKLVKSRVPSVRRN
ncbi:rhomboid family intramembrane serine protease [Planktotalea arctica]|uniref:rhomboid family intramembrane serine protease n=1 Tax=Planktotalea arctica TaxID=1481893 RepID=UPI00321A76C7